MRKIRNTFFFKLNLFFKKKSILYCEISIVLFYCYPFPFVVVSLYFYFDEIKTQCQSSFFFIMLLKKFENFGNTTLA